MTGPDDESAIPFLDPSVPNVARIYDYLLNGKDNYAIDREAAEKLITLMPDAVFAARQNRQFLQRVVNFLTGEAGIRQFIDIGTGLPTRGNVHEIVQHVAPDARVVYVDYDSVVVSHARALLAKQPTVVAIQGDLRKPIKILGHPGLRSIINFDEPVAVLLFAILHFIGEEESPHSLVDALKNAMLSGSYLALSHITDDHVSAEVSRQAQCLYEDATATAVPRTHAQVRRFFDGLDLIPPGVVDVSAWHPESLRPPRTLLYGGIAQKP